jgi:hypothetical protein
MVTAFNMGGQPTATTNVEKRLKTETMKVAVVEAAQMYASEKEKTEASGAKRVASGTLISVMSQIEQKYDLEPGTICPSNLKSDFT